MSEASSPTSGSSGFQSGGALFGPVFLNASRPYRAIGPESAGGSSGSLYFIADVTEQEQHTDQLFITEHPIEAGANISDHAYKRPASIVLNVGWSNSAYFNYDPYYITGIYLNLLKMQADRSPMNIYTGKRVYENMLISGIVVETDETTEWVLRAEISLQQIFITNTQTTTITSNPNNQSNPASSQPTTSTGTQSTLPAQNLNNSSYKTVFPNGSTSNAQKIPVQTQAPSSSVPLNGNAFSDVG